MKPEKSAEALSIMRAEVPALAKHCDADMLQKVKEYMHRKHAEDLKKNAYWMNQLVNKTRFNLDNVKDFDAVVDAITAKDIQDVAKTIFQSGNVIECGMTSPIK